MTSELSWAGDLDTLVAALASREMVVVAPHGTVNTGLVTGDQRQIVSTSADSGTSTGPMRQGPVRAKHLKTVRRFFVPPPGFKEALAALDSGVVVLVGEPGTGRETYALNLLAHGVEEPVLVQVDGAVDLSRWKPRAQGVHGYLVTELPDPFALRAWDLSRLEASLADAKARLVIVLANVPELIGVLEDHLGTPVVRHQLPDPRKVFISHLSDGRIDEQACAEWLRSLEPGCFEELLPEGLPPRYAARAAEAVLRSGVAEGAPCAEVLRDLVRTEGAEIAGRARKDPFLLAHLLSLSVYGGLSRDVVTARAGELVRLAGREGKGLLTVPGPPGGPDGDTHERALSETLRGLGAHRVRCPEGGATERAAFFWPAVGEIVWEVLCRDQTDLLPLLHAWLADPGHEADLIERAGRAVAAMATATGGRSLEHLRGMVLAASVAGPQVAAWGLGTAVRSPATAGVATELLEQWSVATEVPLRETVAYACHPDHGRIPGAWALPLLRRLVENLSDDADSLSVVPAITTALMRSFQTGDSEARALVLREMSDWTELDGAPGLLTAFVFPVLADTDPVWWSDRSLSRAGAVPNTVRLVNHALNESESFAGMRDVLVDWCSKADGAKRRARALDEILDGLVAARQPGFLLWLLAVGRGPDTMPGKETAARALAEWRSRTPIPKTD
ncbi:hypothetical protein [Streptomyces sp. NPDC088757]|uniref:hypothetical protein n=1 Tax=Streptomyces sp. NPDC088757 TaxID=3365889 RepID=UPI00380F8CD4